MLGKLIDLLLMAWGAFSLVILWQKTPDGVVDAAGQCFALVGAAFLAFLGAIMFLGDVFDEAGSR